MSAVVMISGGTRGIGLATAVLMGNQGWKVAITGTNEQSLAGASAILSEGQIEHCVCRFAVQDEAEWETAVESVERKMGPITALVCNAGISPKRAGKKIPFEQADLDVWRRTMAVNLDGVLFGFRTLTPRMMARGSGSMVAVSSIVGRIALPFGSAYYTTSKAAVLGLVRAVAVDLGGYGVRVNAVLPGRIDTEMTQEAGESFNSSLLTQIALGRMGRPEEVAAGIAFLCSESASYISGVSLDIGGGWCIG